MWLKNDSVLFALIQFKIILNPFSDHVAQSDTVLFTLANLEIPQHMLSSMITVGNKIDLVIILCHIFASKVNE